mgnify:CR=1 FL=1
MNSIQNYGVTNYQTGRNNTAFKAKISEPLKQEILKELIPKARKRYSSRLDRRVEAIPGDFTIQGIVNRNDGTSVIRLNHASDSQTFELQTNGNKLDIIEGLLKKDKHGTPQISEFAYRLFSI